MAINQKQVLSLQQKLSPQQIQMIKLLELPAVQLEQRIKQEIEDNIVLEEEERSAEDEEQPPQQISFDETSGRTTRRRTRAASTTFRRTTSSVRSI